MATIIASKSDVLFQLGDQYYPKGAFQPKYLYKKGVLNLEIVYSEDPNANLIEATAWTQFTDINGDAYADEDTFMLAVGNLLFDSGAGSSSVLFTDQGSVTQATNITTGVTLNNRVGTITTVSSTLAADASAIFTLTNSNITATSRIFLSVTYATAATGMPYATVSSKTAGSAVIELTNVGTAVLNAVVGIDFLVL